MLPQAQLAIASTEAVAVETLLLHYATVARLTHPQRTFQ
jgi:hypothetical protein